MKFRLCMIILLTTITFACGPRGPSLPDYSKWDKEEGTAHFLCDGKEAQLNYESYAKDSVDHAIIDIVTIINDENQKQWVALYAHFSRTGGGNVYVFEYKGRNWSYVKEFNKLDDLANFLESRYKLKEIR